MSISIAGCQRVTPLVGIFVGPWGNLVDSVISLSTLPGSTRRGSPSVQSILANNFPYPPTTSRRHVNVTAERWREPAPLPTMPAREGLANYANPRLLQVLSVHEEVRVRARLLVRNNRPSLPEESTSGRRARAGRDIRGLSRLPAGVAKRQCRCGGAVNKTRCRD